MLSLTLQNICNDLSLVLSLFLPSLSNQKKPPLPFNNTNQEYLIIYIFLMVQMPSSPLSRPSLSLSLLKSGFLFLLAKFSLSLSFRIGKPKN
ncbi:uncharacterized protein RNJ42_02742 [Nakaseomyces bracarensis]|uniref:uncharacterized protein n=1 Tax=Nakaseomyces bracarensis TaxID=273131 RepID=UPI003872127F